MRHRTLDEMIAYFNRQVSDMDIKREYKIQLLGMITAIGYEASAQPERKKGKWIAKEDRPKQEVFICSECGGWAYSPWIGSRKNPKPNRCKYTFCPNCGSYNGGET